MRTQAERKIAHVLRPVSADLDSREPFAAGTARNFPLLSFAVGEGSPFSLLSSAAAVMHGTVPAEKIVPLTRALTLGAAFNAPARGRPTTCSAARGGSGALWIEPIEPDRAPCQCHRRSKV